MTSLTLPSFGAQRMHRVLCIPELLDMVFTLLEPSSNAVNARVCKVWSDIALDSLWKDMADLHRLFGILAPLRKTEEEEYEFDRMPETEDWIRFEKYGRRVRRLVYRASNSHTLKQSVFDDVGRTRTRLDIFPNMHTLYWKAPLALCVMFMHRGIKHFAVQLPPELETISPRPFFQDIAARMPNLENIDIRSNIPMRAIEAETIDLLQRLPKLTKVLFPRFYCTTEVAEALSRLEHLGTIEFRYIPEQGCGCEDDVKPFQPVLTEGAFPALWDYSLTALFDDAARFLDATFAPTNLTMLYLDSDIIETSESINRILSVVAENCQLLKFLALVSLRDASSLDSYDGFLAAPGTKITIDTLKPVLKLPNLSTMEIVHQYPLSLREEDIELLASSWPSLETLILNNEPVLLVNSNLTLGSLLPFAKHCPKLTHLGLFLDASSVEDFLDPAAASLPFSPVAPFKTLQRLSMGVSIIKENQGDRVAEYLSQILPLGCKIDGGITWDESREVSVPATEILRVRCEEWAKVQELLPMCTRLRIGERERTKFMERELEDLRMRTGVMGDAYGAVAGVRVDLATCVMI
ncbi:hypothetical protein B0H34DRAFT_861875 [Crassisporium funariophilum]|nr:hypothetical protein B0H34DRAFT_861875 [Crassisporium funariophilum]